MSWHQPIWLAFGVNQVSGKQNGGYFGQDIFASSRPSPKGEGVAKMGAEMAAEASLWSSFRSSLQSSLLPPLQPAPKN
jgi:hypothetical protein